MLIEQLIKEMKRTMVEKDTTIKNAVKNVINRAYLEAKEAKCEITDEIVISAIKKELKQLNQTLDILKSNNKTDTNLYMITEAQKTYLQTYLPKQLSEDEIREEVRKIITTEKNKNLWMKNIMTNLKGKADNKLINQIAKDEISKVS